MYSPSLRLTTGISTFMKSLIKFAFHRRRSVKFRSPIINSKRRGSHSKAGRQWIEQEPLVPAGTQLPCGEASQWLGATRASSAFPLRADLRSSACRGVIIIPPAAFLRVRHHERRGSGRCARVGKTNERGRQLEWQMARFRNVPLHRQPTNTWIGFRILPRCAGRK